MRAAAGAGGETLSALQTALEERRHAGARTAPRTQAGSGLSCCPQLSSALFSFLALSSLWRDVAAVDLFKVTMLTTHWCLEGRWISCGRLDFFLISHFHSFRVLVLLSLVYPKPVGLMCPEMPAPLGVAGRDMARVSARSPALLVTCSAGWGCHPQGP